MTSTKADRASLRVKQLASGHCTLSIAFAPESRKRIDELGRAHVLSRMQVISASPLRLGSDPDSLNLYGFTCRRESVVEDIAYIARYGYEVLELCLNISCPYPGFDSEPAGEALEETPLAA